MFDHFVCALQFLFVQVYCEIRNLRNRGNYRGMHLIHEESYVLIWPEVLITPTQYGM